LLKRRGNETPRSQKETKMKALKLPPVVVAMLATTIMADAAEARTAEPIDEAFPDVVAVAGCPSQCGCGTSKPSISVPIVLDKALAGGNSIQAYALGDTPPGTMPEGYAAYVDQRLDEACMGAAVGTATVAAGATATINVEPTQGCFDGYYMQIIVVDNAAPNTRGRGEVARFFIGDCPRECRSGNVFTDAYEGLSNGCCMGVPFRAKFGKTANGEQLNVVFTNPTGGFANARVQVIAKGFCRPSPASCTT